jgi:hypothetical protein
LFLEYVREVFLPAVESNYELQDIEESQQFYFATTAHGIARMRSYGSSHLMEFF